MIKNSPPDNKTMAQPAAVLVHPESHTSKQAVLAKQAVAGELLVRRTHYDSVQAMRALSVLAVILYHVAMRQRQDFSHSNLTLAYPISLIGHCGVDLFFIISGFIIATVNWGSFGKPKAIRDYGVKRLIRIYPVYWLTSLPLLVLGCATAFDWKSIVGAIVLLPHYADRINLVAWSLSYEILFYAVFALFLLGSERLLPIFMGLWFFCIVGDGLVPVVLKHFSIVQNFFRPLNIEFILGLSVACFVRKNLFFKKPWLLVVIGLVGLVGAMALKHFGANPYPEYDGRVRALIFGVPAALLLYAAIVAESMNKFVCPKLILLVGDASYSIYLVHFELIRALMLNNIVRSFCRPLEFILWELLVVTIVLAVGSLIHLRIEKPMLTVLKHRLLL